MQKEALPHELEKAITAEDVLGKDVIDTQGSFIGVTDKLLLDPKTLRVIGVSVDKGFLKKGLIIGTAYIKEVTPHAVLLNTRPAFQIKGMDIFCSEGKKVGIVEHVTITPSGKIKELIGDSTVFGKKIHIPSTIIAQVEASVMLSITHKELTHLLAAREKTPE